jgi:hypothetical protein
VLVLLERVSEAQRIASKDIREMQQETGGRKKKRSHGDDGKDAGANEGGADGIINGALKKGKGHNQRHNKQPSKKRR